MHERAPGVEVGVHDDRVDEVAAVRQTGQRYDGAPRQQRVYRTCTDIIVGCKLCQRSLSRKITGLG